VGVERASGVIEAAAGRASEVPANEAIEVAAGRASEVPANEAIEAPARRAIEVAAGRARRKVFINLAALIVFNLALDPDEARRVRGLDLEANGRAGRNTDHIARHRSGRTQDGHCTRREERRSRAEIRSGWI
jgi:hypothetical protein